MPFVNIKKQYLALAMLIFVVLFIFSSRPAFQCQFTPVEVNTYLPTIYAITPTYKRLAQKADLTRLSQTLMHVKNFHWVVIEDSEEKTSLVSNLLKESTLKYTHLQVKTHKAKHSTASGVEQRNAALDWLKKHLADTDDKRGIVYFMDDDNTYSLKVFDEMRKIRKVGVWPVGLVGGMRVEMPLVSNGKVTGFNAVWKPFRPFPIDMAGFAINATLFLDYPDAKFSRKVQSGFQGPKVTAVWESFRPFPIDMAGFAINATLFLEHPDARFSRKVQSGLQESEILKYFTTPDELEALADNCTKVYVWHTRTQRTQILNPKKLKHPPIPDDHIEV